MLDKFGRAAALWVSVTAMGFVTAIPVSAQQPTDQQRSAIRSACRADYEANCASVPPGGMASLQCLQKNMSKLSAACQSAVSAIEPVAAAPKTEAAPVQSPPPPSAPATAAPKPATTAPNTPKAAAKAPPTKPAAPAATGAPASGSTASPAVAADPAPPVLVLRPMRPREELFVLRSACAGDVRAVCGNVAPGGGRIVQCLATNAPALSPACKEVLGQFAAQ